MVGLVACGGESSDTGGEIESANQRQRTAAPTATPSPLGPAPTTDSPEVAITSVQLENVPADLTGHLVLTWGEALFITPLDGTAVEPVLKDQFVRWIHGDIAITGSFNVEDNTQDVSLFDITTGESVTLTTLPDDHMLRPDKWSPDGQWLTMHIDKQGPTFEYEGQPFFTSEPVDYMLFSITGEQVELPITPPTNETQVGAGWLMDNTLLIADGVTQSSVAHVLHVDPTTDEVTELDIPAMSRNNFMFLTFYYSEFAMEQMNRDLEEYGLELAPVDFDFAFGIPQVIAPDNSYSVKIDLQGSGIAGVCGDYYVTQQPIEAAFTTRMLYSGKARQVSDLILHDEQVYYFHTMSPTCEENDLQVELMRITNFDNPIVETLYTAKPATEIEAQGVYGHLLHDHYLLWTAIEDDNTNIFLTDMNTGETRILMSAPYVEGQAIPHLYAVMEDL